MEDDDRQFEAPNFQHQPLRLDVASTRLLDVLPLDDNGVIKCKIQNAILATSRDPETDQAKFPAPSYTCLSYVWGLDAGIHSIMINGGRFEVHENLYEFLRMLARKRRRAQQNKCVIGQDSIDVEACAKSLWIDALCIDQASIRERNHQVQQMGRIYSQAKEVVVWLGEDEGIADLFRFAATLTPFNRRSDAQNLSQHIDAIHNLFDHVYWSRAWITQELALASATHFTALDASISSNTLNLLGTRLKHTYGENMIQKMWTPIRQHQRGTLRLTIFDNLLQYQNKECTDERDLVYSLLSMSRNGGKIQVNYQCTKLELALDVLRSCEGGPCLHRISSVLEALGIRVQGPLAQSQLGIIELTGFVYHEVKLREPCKMCSQRVQPITKTSTELIFHDTCGVCSGVVKIPLQYVGWGTYHIYCLGCDHLNMHQRRDMGGGHLCLCGPLDPRSLIPTQLLLVKGGRCSELQGVYRAVSDLDETSVRLQLSLQLILEILSQQSPPTDNVTLAPQLRMNDTSGAWAHWKVIESHHRRQLAPEFGGITDFRCSSRKDADGITVCMRCSGRRRRSALLQHAVEL